MGSRKHCPSAYPLPLHDKIGLYEALAAAGGIGWRAQIDENVKIIRADKSIEIYDLSPNQDYREIDVKDGDIIFVSGASAAVQVRGQVQEGGAIPNSGNEFA